MIVTIIRVWQDGTHAYVCVRAPEGGARGNVEYIASMPLADIAAMTAADKKIALTAAVKAVRDSQLKPAPADIAGISGTVTI